MPLTVGTAGHIDHGKTWLVRALTGKDTDRLPEERERGISIDLGYAPLDLPDGRRALADRRPGTRALRPEHGRRRNGDRPLPPRRRRRRGRAAADARAPRDPLAARDRARRRCGHEGGCGRRRDARARSRGGAGARPGSRGGRGEREDRSRARRAQGRAVARGRPCVTGTQARLRTTTGAPLRRPRVLAARDRDGRDGDALVGIDRRRRRASRRARRTRRPRAQRPGARPPGRAGRPGPASGRRAPGRRAARARGGAMRCFARGRSRPSYRLDVALEELAPIADGARLHVHHGTAAVPARVVRTARASRSSGSQRRSSQLAATASSSVARRPSAAAS